MGLPNFIIAGFQKCGTTALWRNLKQHPKLYTTNNKELDFFLVKPQLSAKHKPPRKNTLGDVGTAYLPRFDQPGGEARYKSMFKSKPGELWFECSPNYSNQKHEATLRNILSLYGNTKDLKIIFTIRDPVARAFSAYNHYRQVLPVSKKWGGWNTSKGFRWNIENNNAFHSFYADVIRHYLRFIPKSNIHVVVQEWLVSNPEREYNKIFDFLGVSRVDIQNSAAHSRRYPKNRYLRKDAEAALIKHYTPLNQELFELLGYEIPEWQ